MSYHWQDSINSLIELSLKTCNSLTVAVLRTSKRRYSEEKTDCREQC